MLNLSCGTATRVCLNYKLQYIKSDKNDIKLLLYVQLKQNNHLPVKKCWPCSRVSFLPLGSSGCSYAGCRCGLWSPPAGQSRWWLKMPDPSLDITGWCSSAHPQWPQTYTWSWDSRETRLNDNSFNQCILFRIFKWLSQNIRVVRGQPFNYASTLCKLTTVSWWLLKQKSPGRAWRWSCMWCQRKPRDSPGPSASAGSLCTCQWWNPLQRQKTAPHAHTHVCSLFLWRTGNDTGCTCHFFVWHIDEKLRVVITLYIFFFYCWQIPIGTVS